MAHTPHRTYANPHDGNTYYLAPLGIGQDEVLWACPTKINGTAEFAAAIPETAFEERLSAAKRKRILKALTH